MILRLRRRAAVRAEEEALGGAVEAGKALVEEHRDEPQGAQSEHQLKQRLQLKPALPHRVRAINRRLKN